MKRAISILLALVMILALVACTGNPQTSDNSTPSNTQESASAAEKKFTVGFALNDLDEAQSVIYQHLERFCEEKNIELILANAAGSIDQQLTDIESGGHLRDRLRHGHQQRGRCALRLQFL